jgi:hypothetical protein
MAGSIRHVEINARKNPESEWLLEGQLGVKN